MQLAAVDNPSYLSHFIVAPSKRDGGGGGCFSPDEIQQTAAERKIHWVGSDGTPAPGLGEISDVNKVLLSLQRVLSVEHSTVGEVNLPRRNRLTGFTSAFGP